ncbi:hypothetical protein AKJ16_DCAP11778, partial [Drosera capensis]
SYPASPIRGFWLSLSSCLLLDRVPFAGDISSRRLSPISTPATGNMGREIEEVSGGKVEEGGRNSS